MRRGPIWRIATSVGAAALLHATVIVAPAIGEESDTCMMLFPEGITAQACLIATSPINPADERPVPLDPPARHPAFLGEDFPGDGLFVPAADNDSGSTGCLWTPHSPHYSRGAGGVIAKSSWTCESDVSFTHYYLTLFLCDTDSPDGREADWVSSGQCSVAAKGPGRTINDPGNTWKYPNGQRIRYVPEKPAPGVRTNGYYIQCVQWYWGTGGREYIGGQRVSPAVGIWQF